MGVSPQLMTGSVSKLLSISKGRVVGRVQNQAAKYFAVRARCALLVDQLSRELKEPLNRMTS